MESEHFYKQVREDYRAIDVEVSKWKSGKDDLRVRTIYCLQPVRMKIPGVKLPSHAPFHKLQMMKQLNQVENPYGKHLEIFEQDRISGIPFSSYFKLYTFWSIQPTDHDSCAVQATVCIHFKRKFILQQFVAKGVLREASHFMNHWYAHAQHTLLAQQRSPAWSTTTSCNPSYNKKVAIEQAAGRLISATARGFNNHAQQLQQKFNDLEKQMMKGFAMILPQPTLFDCGGRIVRLSEGKKAKEQTIYASIYAPAQQTAKTVHLWSSQGNQEDHQEDIYCGAAQPETRHDKSAAVALRHHFPRVETDR